MLRIGCVGRVLINPRGAQAAENAENSEVGGREV